MASNFVDNSLGRWSSHPEKLRKQKLLFLILGVLPIIAAVVICVLIYRDISSLDRIKDQVGLLTCSVFFVFGFLLTICMLYLACFTIGSKKGKVTNKDDLIFPLWLLIVFGFFPLVTYGLSLLPDLIERYLFLKNLKFEIGMDPRAFKAILNMVSIAPFLCLLTWLLCAKEEEELKENEKLVRRPWVLSIALACIGSLVVSFFVPKYRLAIWVILLPFSLISLTLWWFWKQKITLNKEETAETEEKDEEEEKKPKLPEQAAYIIKKLEEVEGISYDGDGQEQQITNFSHYIEENESTFPLIALMNGKIPTADQADFLNRFSSLYEDTLNNFIESTKPNSEQILPDIILQGPDGSGRTEALCAAAVYAAAVRGQNVLYMVQDGSYASSLAEKMKSRFRDLLIDCYYTVDYLKPNFVAAWLPAENEQKTADDKREVSDRNLPPNILFATPEQVEFAFFSIVLTNVS